MLPEFRNQTIMVLTGLLSHLLCYIASVFIVPHFQLLLCQVPHCSFGPSVVAFPCSVHFVLASVRNIVSWSLPVASQSAFRSFFYHLPQHQTFSSLRPLWDIQPEIVCCVSKFDTLSNSED